MSPIRIHVPTLDDAPAVHAMLARANQLEIGRDDGTEAELRAAWGEPEFDLSSDGWLLRSGPDCIGYAELTARTPGLDFDADHRVDPHHDSPESHQLLIRAMLERASVLSTSPEAMISEYAPRQATLRQTALIRAGFHVERVIHRLVIELHSRPEAVQWPPSIRIQSMQDEQDARDLHAVLQSAFADHYRFAAEDFENWLARTRAHPNHDPELFRVVRRAGEPIAAIETLDHGEAGWIPHLGVLPAARGQGLGRALLRDAFAALWDRGQRRIELAVDSDNATGATQLYESVGMRRDVSYDLFRRRVHIP